MFRFISVVSSLLSVNISLLYSLPYFHLPIPFAPSIFPWQPSPITLERKLTHMVRERVNAHIYVCLLGFRHACAAVQATLGDLRRKRQKMESNLADRITIERGSDLTGQTPPLWNTLAEIHQDTEAPGNRYFLKNISSTLDSSSNAGVHLSRTNSE